MHHHKQLILWAVLLLGLCGGVLPTHLRAESSNESPAVIGATPQTTEIRDCTGLVRRIPVHPSRIILVRGRDIYELAALLGEELPARLLAYGPDLESSDADAYQVFTQRFPSLVQAPRTGDIFRDAVSAEQLIELKPDLIILDVFMRERGYRCLDALEKAGLPLLYLDETGDPFESSLKSLELLGKVLGEKADARAQLIAAKARGRIGRLLGRLADDAIPCPSVYFETGGDPDRPGASFGSYGSPPHRSGWGEVLHRLRVTNIAEGHVVNMASLQPEYVLEANPSWIVLSGQSWRGQHGLHLGFLATAHENDAQLQRICARPGWSSLKAVRSGRVFAVYHNFCMHFFNFACLEAMAKAFHPDLFQDLNPEEDLQAFLKEFLPVEPTGTWLLAPTLKSVNP